MDVYGKLREHLDKLPGGYPATESGVEIRILKRLFTPEQAELALYTTLMPEPAGAIAQRAGISEQEAEERLMEMSRAGILFSVEVKDRPTLYMAVQFVVGIWEFQVNRLTEGLVKDMQEYMPELFDLETWKQASQLRTIPIQASLPAGGAAMPYNQAEEIVKQQKKIALMPCICRQEHHISGGNCQKPEEVCLAFGSGAYYYLKNGLGREITQEEALEVLKIANEAALVLQPGNYEKVQNICCCCGDCCGVLLSYKRHPKPADICHSPYIVKFDPDECINCEICIDRCQMDVFSPGDDVVSLNMNNCIGCGLCVTTCTGEALTLERKPDDQVQHLPKGVVENSIDILKVRGLM